MSALVSTAQFLHFVRKNRKDSHILLSVHGGRGEENFVPLEAREGGKGVRQLSSWRGEPTLIPAVGPENGEESLSRAALISAGRPTLKNSCAQALTDVTEEGHFENEKNEQVK